MPVDAACARRRGVDSGYRCRLRTIHRCCRLAPASQGSHLEQPLVSSLGIRRNQLHEKLGLRRLRGRWIMDWSVCLADAITRGRKEQGGEALLGLFRFWCLAHRACHHRVTRYQSLVRNYRAPADVTQRSRLHRASDSLEVVAVYPRKAARTKSDSPISVRT